MTLFLLRLVGNALNTTLTRFAPSPTGLLHLGHAYSALFAYRHAVAQNGRFILRIEDIDRNRFRPEFDQAIVDDLSWLGLTWEEPVRRQSEHLDDYGAALSKLDDQGLIYPCFCTRKDIADEIKGADAAPHGPDGPLYPGICRGLSPQDIADRQEKGMAFALRLDMKKAIGQAGKLYWTDESQGRQQCRPEIFGDVVLARKDTPTSYHLAVTLDDALQGITLVTRGTDLFEATHVHRLLQFLLNLPCPHYHHHPLLTDENGNRFAKRDKSLTIQSLREAGHGPEDVQAMAFSRAGHQ